MREQVVDSNIGREGVASVLEAYIGRATVDTPLYYRWPNNIFQSHFARIEESSRLVSWRHRRAMYQLYELASRARINRNTWPCVSGDGGGGSGDRERGDRYFATSRLVVAQPPFTERFGWIGWVVR